MASIFESFNNLAGNLVGNNPIQTAQNVNRFTQNLGRASSSFSNLSSGRGSTIDNVRSGLNAVDNLISAAGGGSSGVGKAIRMANNAIQGVFPGAAPTERTFSKAIIRDTYSTVDAEDWRVKITAPSDLVRGPVRAPIADTGNSMIFPFTPTIILGASANYSNVQPVHTNHPFYVYENSQTDQITITGEFFSENAQDAAYWVACLHFLRTMTKMFYGQSDDQGNPPPVCRLNGYGKHVFNNVPVLITNFTTDMPADVDYIECNVNGNVDYVPTQSIFTVTVVPNYARSAHARFSLQSFAKGDTLQTNEGFI